MKTISTYLTFFKNDAVIIKQFLNLVHILDSTYIVLIVFSCFLKALIPYVNIILPKMLIDEMLDKQRVEYLIFYIFLLSALNAAGMLIINFINMKFQLKNNSLVMNLEMKLGQNIMNIEFSKLEDPEFLNKKEQAMYAVNTHNVVFNMLNSLSEMVQSVITLIGLSVLISLLNPLLICCLLIVVLFNLFIYQKNQKTQIRFHEDIAPLNKKYGYYNNLAIDFSLAKDVRIYNMSDYIIKKINTYNKECMTIFTKMYRKRRIYDGIINLTIQLQTSIIYIYMIYMAFNGAISIGEFTMYVSAAITFTSIMSSFLNNFISIKQICIYMNKYLEFYEKTKNKVFIEKSGKIRISEINNIEFRNVWFHYPGNNSYTLKDITLTITKGEKISIIGHNGAGKTTFIKLLCHLYTPNKGIILVNDIPLENINQQDYMNCLASIFQDFNIFSFSFKDNIICGSEENNEKLSDIINKIGLGNKVENLKNKSNTVIYKNFDKDGIELSGGEMQKVAILRAIYKNTSLLILDEPTSALDPKVEFEIYSNFENIIGDRMAIYISHRLSSCKLCDRIMVFDNGKIIETGDFNDLYTHNGLFREMWDSQVDLYTS
jgi:ATP-binding cassette subfamily B protein/ATP-binding cassette subfamily C protein